MGKQEFADVTYEVASADANRGKNRYRDVLAKDSTRVKLLEYVLPTRLLMRLDSAHAA